MHWFVDNFGLYTGSVRGLFMSDFSPEYDAYIESSVINLRARGIEPFLTIGEQIVLQAETLWSMATTGTPFNQPHVTMFELDMLRADVAIIKDLEAPVTPSQLWYLYHYIIYPRALFNKATVITTSLGLDEFIAYGAECDDFEYAGRKLSWEKLMWLVEATMIDLYQFRQVKTDGHPPMLKAEYNLFNAMTERGLPVTAQQVLGDYMLDMSIADRDNRLAIEVDVLASLDPNVPNSGEAKKNLVLLSDGWKILRFTAAEIFGDLTACVDAVEQVWTQGRKKAAVGRLMSGREQPKIPELPVDDDSQKLAITHGAGPVAVTGGAGTGKTSTVSHRIGYLLAQGVCPERILVFSHSEETIGQLKRKVEVLSDAQTVQRISFSDWKDIGLRILKENAVAVKRKPPLKLESAPHRVLQRVLKKEMKDIDPLQLELMEADIDEVSIGQLISLYKANLITPERIKERATTDAEDLVAKLFLAYEEALKKSNKVDPDDTISLTAQLLADDPEVRAKYQHKYEYVLVDEYQECSAAADLMARILAFPQDNLFLVGDEDECVTENKGALPRLMADTSIRMPNARCYILDKNWRSHPAIVDHSRSLASALGIKGIIKDMLPGYGTAATSAVIGPQQCKSEEAEADWVANEVSILIESGKSLNDIVVLWRNQRYSSLLEAALFKKNIKCQSLNASSESVPDEVGDVMAFLRLVMDPDGPKARASFERFCQLKSREMDQKLSRLSNTIASFAEANNLSFLKAIEIYHDATADSSCEDLAQLVRIVRTMNQEGLPPAQTIGLLKRTQKLNEIYAAVKVPPGVVYEPMRKVEQLEEEAKAYTTVREFVKAKQEFLEGNKDAVSEETAVQLKSFEDSKGNEYPIVFLTGMAEGLCPAEAAANYEEERRLTYVAMTRAKELLYISYPATYEEKPLPPSPFLVEARLLPINVYRKAVELIQVKLPPKPAEQAEPAAPGSGMLTPIMTGRPERVRPARAERNRENAPAAPGGGAPAPPQGTAPGGAPPHAPQRGNRPGSDVADLLGGRIAAPGGNSPTASGAQPIIRPAGHSANLARPGSPEAGQPAVPSQPGVPSHPAVPGQPGVPGQPAAPGHPAAPHDQANPFVGFEADKTRVVDEARQRAENEAKLKAQYEAHITAQQEAATQAELEAQRRAEQDAYLRARHEQQMREQQEALMRAQQEEMLRRAQEEAARKEHNELRLRAEQQAELRAQQEAEIQAQREAAIRAQQEAELRAKEEAEQRAREEAELKAQHDAMLLLVQQEAARRAQEEAEILTQQQAAQQALEAAEARSQAEALARAQAEAEARAQQEAAAIVELEAQRQAQIEAARLAQQQAEQQAALAAQQQAAQQTTGQQSAQQQAQIQSQHEAAARAQQEALARVQEKAAQRAMIDLELRMAQEAALRDASQDAQTQDQPVPGSISSAEPTATEGAARPAAATGNFAGSPGADIDQLVDQQFNFAGVPILNSENENAPAQAPVVDPDRAKEEDVVRSNREILEEMSPAERGKQQDALRKKAREKLVSKGRKKKGAAAETDSTPAVEPTKELAPAAVPSPTTSDDKSSPPPPAPVYAEPHQNVPPPTPAPSSTPAYAEPQHSVPPPSPAYTHPQPPAPVYAEPQQNVPPPAPAYAEPQQNVPPSAPPNQPAPSAVPGFDRTPPAFAQPAASAMPPSPYGQPQTSQPGQQDFFSGSKANTGQSSNGSPSQIPPSPFPQSAPLAVPAPPDPYSLPPGLFPEAQPAPEAPKPAPQPPEPQPLVSQPQPIPKPVPQPQSFTSQPQGFPQQPQEQGPQPEPQSFPQPQSQPQPYVSQPQPYGTPPFAPQPQPVESAPVIRPIIPKATATPPCPQCSAQLEPGARFCGECGLHLQPAKPVSVTCPSCSFPLEPNARFCGECGHSLR